MNLFTVLVKTGERETLIISALPIAVLQLIETKARQHACVDLDGLSPGR
jgi:hypothetical protein